MHRSHAPRALGAILPLCKHLHAHCSYCIVLYPNGTFRPPSKSANDALKLCFDDRLPAKGEALYLNGTEVLETAKMMRDVPSRKEVWAYSLDAAGITKNDTILQDWQ